MLGGGVCDGGVSLGRNVTRTPHAIAAFGGFAPSRPKSSLAWGGAGGKATQVSAGVGRPCGRAASSHRWLRAALWQPPPPPSPTHSLVRILCWVLGLLCGSLRVPEGVGVAERGKRVVGEEGE